MIVPKRIVVAPALAAALCAAGCLDPDAPGNLVPRTVAEDPSLPSVRLNGTVLHAESYGDPSNPLVVVIHGGPGTDHRGLLPLAALADDGYRVVFWDQRGTGLSERLGEGAFTWDALLEDLRQVVDHYGDPTRPTVLVGMSWGAMYATWFIDAYGTYGGRIRGAVLSEPGGFTKAQLDAYMRRLNGSVTFLDRAINDMTWVGQFVSPATHARADYLMMIQGIGDWPAVHCDASRPEPHWRFGAVAARRMEALAEGGFDWTTHLKAFAPRVLFLRGDRNEANRLQDQLEMAAAYASADVVTIPDVGHCLIWERPAEYLQNVRAYFQAIGFAGGRP